MQVGFLSGDSEADLGGPRPSRASYRGHAVSNMEVVSSDATIDLKMDTILPAS